MVRVINIQHIIHYSPLETGTRFAMQCNGLHQQVNGRETYQARGELPLRLCTGTYNPGDDGVVGEENAAKLEDDEDDHKVERGIAIGEDMQRMFVEGLASWEL